MSESRELTRGERLLALADLIHECARSCAVLYEKRPPGWHLDPVWDEVQKAGDELNELIGSEILLERALA